LAKPGAPAIPFLTIDPGACPGHDDEQPIEESSSKYTNQRRQSTRSRRTTPAILAELLAAAGVVGVQDQQRRVVGVKRAGPVQTPISRDRF
jgi:hypothetical protein